MKNILLFTFIDYASFGAWIFISFIISWVLIRKFNFFGGSREQEKTLTLGLIAGHLVYISWKNFALFIISFF